MVTAITYLYGLCLSIFLALITYFMSVTDKLIVPNPILLSFHLIFFTILCVFSPRPDWRCIGVKQMDNGWGIGPASLWHWARFKPGKWSMLNLILNTRSFTPANRWRMEASIWQHSWGTLIRDFKSTCSCSCACVFVCCYLLLNGLLNTGINCLVHKIFGGCYVRQLMIWKWW